MTRAEKISARRERAFVRWQAFKAEAEGLRLLVVGWRAWRWLLAWDALYHAELRTNPAALAAAKR